MKQFKFEDLRVYQQAVAFSSDIFALTKKWSPIYRYTLGDQFQRAALSISLNIAEGSSRTKKDFQHFLSIARGSCYECVPILQISKDHSLLTAETYNALYEKLVMIAKMITVLRRNIA